MSDIKCLVTSGCSFSEPYIRKTWPLWLEEKINSDNLFKLHYGLPSQGNNLIARKVIYGIHTALKEFKPDEILVGMNLMSLLRGIVSRFNKKSVLLIHDKRFLSES